MGEEYKVGALSALISGSGESGGEGGGLFTTEKKQKDPVFEPATTATSTEEDQKSPAKNRKRKNNLLSKDKGGGGGQIIHKKPKLKDGGSDEEEEEGEEDAEGEYTRPSLSRLVKMEDAKERIVDEEKEKRTVFVGNLPLTVKEKKIKKIFSEFGKVETVKKYVQFKKTAALIFPETV